MDTAALVTAIGATTLDADLIAIMTAYLTLFFKVVGITAVFGLIFVAFRRLAGRVSGAGHKL